MAYTDINSEDRLVQATFAEHLEKVLGKGGLHQPVFAVDVGVTHVPVFLSAYWLGYSPFKSG